MAINIEYELKESDYQEFNVQHHALSTSSRKRRLRSKWIISVLYAAIGIYFILDYRLVWSAAIGAVFVAVAIGWFMFYERYYYSRIRKNTLKLLNEGSNAGMLGKQSLSLTEESIRVKDANGEGEYKGPFIKRIVENNMYIYCYVSSIMALIIPKDAFGSEQELEQFRCGIKNFKELGKDRGDMR